MESLQQDSKFYIDGAKRMISEGKEAVSKILAFMRENEAKLKELEEFERKKFVLTFEPAKMFNEIHPIVFQYLAIEGIFHAGAFKRYILSVYGKPKDQEELTKAKQNKKTMYRYKNAQSALYYKYLLIETNPHIPKTQIHKMYEDTVAILNENTDRMVDVYEKAEEETKILEARYSAEKRAELLELLRKKI